MKILMAASARSTNTASLVEGLANCGDEVHVATLHPGPLPAATVHSLGAASRGLSRTAFLAAVPAFRRLHRMLAPDITLGYYASSYGVLTAFAPGPRVVATAGGDVLREAQDSALRRLAIPLLARLALSRADLVLCWAPHLARAARALGATDSRIMTLPRGIDTELFRVPDRPPEHPPTIVSTRALDPFYRPGVLLDAFALARSQGLEARLVFVGDGPAAPELRDRSASLGMDGVVTFTGRLTVVELAERLRHSHVYASFPKSEGLSASLLEAMATGLLPVVNDLAANTEWVRDGANGLTVREPVTPASIAAALRRAVDDASLATWAREKNPVLVRQLASRSANALRFHDAFRELARSRGRDV
ncbi:MAG TPA: glycosyltransferase family 4 protein [Candidatus Polarisedimenticolaceae bacterium]